MSHNAADPRFTWTDLEQWTGLGLLQPEQLTAIRAHLTTEDAPVAAHVSVDNLERL